MDTHTPKSSSAPFLVSSESVWADKRQDETKRADSLQRDPNAWRLKEICVCVCVRERERERERERGLSELLKSILFHLVICCLSVWALETDREAHDTQQDNRRRHARTHTHTVKKCEHLQRVASELYAMCKPNKTTCQAHRVERREGEIISADFWQMGIKKVILYV